MATIVVGLLGALAAFDAGASIAALVVIVVLVLAGWLVVIVPIALLAVIFLETLVPSGLALIALAVVVAELSLGRARLAVTAPLVWAGAYAAWAGVSALWTSDLGASAIQFTGFGLALCLMLGFGALVGSRSDLRLVLYGLTGFAALTGVAGMALFAVGAVDRAAGLQDDANIFAMNELVVLPLVLAAAAEARRTWVRIACYVGVAVILAAVVASLSRGGLIALAVVLALLAVTPRSALYRSGTQRFAVQAFVVAVSVVALGLASGALAERFETSEEEAAGTGRVNEWRAGLTAFERDPLIGLGFGGFTVESNELLRSTPRVDLRTFTITEGGQRVHSAYIGAAAELGLVGLTLYLGLLLSTALALRRVAVRANDSLPRRTAVALLIALAGFATASLFLSTEYSFILFTIVGLTLALEKLLSDERPASDRAVAGDS